MTQNHELSLSSAMQSAACDRRSRWHRPLALALCAGLAAPLPAAALSLGVELGDRDRGGIGAEVSVGHGSLASVDANVGSLDADAEVLGSSNSVADACVGACGGSTTPGGGTTPGNTPGTPGSPGTPGTPGTPGNPGGTPVAGLPGTVPGAGSMALAVVPGPYGCAKGGNTTAFNGYPIVDRSGMVIGHVHSAELSGTTIASVRMRTASNSCATVANGGFSVTGQAVHASFDGARYGLAPVLR